MAVDANEVQAGGQDVAAGDPQESSSQPRESAGGGLGDWFRSAFGFLGGGADQQETTEGAASAGGQESDQGQPATDKADGPVTVSRDELARLVQSEADKEIARRNRVQETRAQRAERLRLAREEPYKLADQVEQELTAQEQAESHQAQFVQSLRPVLQIVDAEVVGAVVGAMPEAAREKLFAEMPSELTGIAQRKHIVASGLAALEAHWRAEGAKEAEAKMANGQMYQKAYAAGQRESREEPELIPAAGVAHRTDMDSILRAGFGVTA